MGVTKETIKPGDGVTFPQKGDRLTMHYTGTLADGGKQFDSSVSRGKPFQFVIGIGQVIEGWDQGVIQIVEELLGKHFSAAARLVSKLE